MAQPKKRTSKSKKNSRKSSWKKASTRVGQQALSLAKSVLYSRNKKISFIYSIDTN